MQQPFASIDASIAKQRTPTARKNQNPRRDIQIITNENEVARGGTQRHLVSSARHKLASELSPNNKAQTLQVNTDQEVAVDLLYLEDFDAELDPVFIKKELKPYFNGIFDDLALRSTPVTNKSAGKSIDKVTFVEYI